MDYTKQSHYTINLISHPAHLWLGDESILVKKTETTLQHIFCTKNGCGTCASCLQILERQHSFILWINPEKNYTLDLLEPVFKTISFALEKNKQFFFVLQKADFFNQACANALLKLLEEPPTGYHFILLAERADYLLPTIRSRCLIQKTYLQTAKEAHQIITWFKQDNAPDPITFTQFIDKSTLHERESFELIDELFQYWLSKHTQAIALHDHKKTKQLNFLISTCQEMLQKSPMPGSSKIFWKDFYLRITAHKAQNF